MNHAAVDAHRGIARRRERNALGAPHTYALVAEEAVGEEQPNAVEHLRGLRRANHGHVEQSVVRHCARRLPVAARRTDAERHGAAVVDLLAGQIEGKSEGVALEKQQHGGKQVRKRVESAKGARLAAQARDRCRHAEVDAVEEIIFLPALAAERANAHIDLALMTAQQGVDGGAAVARIEFPKACEVVAVASGYYAQGRQPPLAAIDREDAAEGMVERGIAAHDDNLFIAGAGHHRCQAFHRPRAFAPHVVERCTALLQQMQDFAQTAARAALPVARAEDNAHIGNFAREPLRGALGRNIFASLYVCRFQFHSR